MTFHFQRTANDAHWGTIADQLMALHQGEEYASPKALRDQLQSTIDHNGLDLRIVQMNGTMNIQGPAGIILRIRSTN